MALTYPQALEYLNSLINYEVRQPAAYTPALISLDRPRALLAALGDPQERYPTIHVAGTKGKGSTSAMCASILRAAGYKVGFYLSPHLQDFRERFRVDDALIPPETLAAVVEKIHAHAVPDLTYWEAITALGFEYFAQEQVDIAVIEVGLGGRLDATNVLSKPRVSVITSLSYDHVALLGNSIAQIAGEKAGIIKPGVPVVCAPQPPEALEVITQVAAERGAALTVIGREWRYESGTTQPYRQPFRAGHAAAPLVEYQTPLVGEHQSINATVALAALEHSGFTIPAQARHDGLARVNWPGRFEIVNEAPYIILDSAHNGDSANRLADTLRALFPGKRITLIFGALADKDLAGMFRALLPLTARLVFVKARSPRAFDPETLRQRARALDYNGPITLATDTTSALAKVRAEIAPDGIIVATGSLTVVGELRDVLGLPVARAAYLDHLAAEPPRFSVEG